MLIWEKGHHHSWMADKAFIICINQKNLEKQRTVTILMKGKVILLDIFFQALRTSFYLFEEKKNPKGTHWNFWHSNTSLFEYLSINPWVTGKIFFFFNPSISNPSEHDYTWNFKFGSLSFLHMAIVKLHITHVKTFVFWQGLGGMGSSEESSILGS